MLNRSGPGVEPCGTPYLSAPTRSLVGTKKSQHKLPGWMEIFPKVISKH